MLQKTRRTHGHISAPGTRQHDPQPERAPLAANLLVGATALVLLALLAAVILAI